MSETQGSSERMYEIKAIIRPFMLDKVLHALAEMDDVPGVTISTVRGWGRTRAAGAEDTSEVAGHQVAEKTKVEIVLPASKTPQVLAAITDAARTGRPGDGKVFVYEVRQVIRIRTGEQGAYAI